MKIFGLIATAVQCLFGATHLTASILLKIYYPGDTTQSGIKSQWSGPLADVLLPVNIAIASMSFMPICYTYAGTNYFAPAYNFFVIGTHSVYALISLEWYHLLPESLTSQWIYWCVVVFGSMVIFAMGAAVSIIIHIAEKKQYWLTLVGAPGPAVPADTEASQFV